MSSGRLDEIRVDRQRFDETVMAAKHAAAPIRKDAPVNQETFMFALAWLIGLGAEHTKPPRRVPAWAFPDEEMCS